MWIELWGGPLDGFVLQLDPQCEDHPTTLGHVHATTLWGPSLATLGGLMPTKALFEDEATAHVHTMSCGVWRYRQAGYEAYREDFPVPLTKFDFIPVVIAG